MYLRKAIDRGQADLGWLKAKYTFSFAGYFSRQHMGFRALRVINQDIVQPGRGFDTHSHQDMEIVTYVLRGSLQHTDSQGHSSQLRHTDVQRMSAGTGIRHSEYNADAKQELELLQIWIEPQTQGLEPAYEEKNFPLVPGLTLLASGHGKENALYINRNIEIFRGHFAASKTLDHRTDPARFHWIQNIRGDFSVNDQSLQAGDGLGLSAVSQLKIKSYALSSFNSG